jgi:hypothetical protein
MGCDAASTAADAGAPGGGLFIGIDGSQHRTGNNSLRVIGTAGDGCGFYAIDTTAFAGLGPQVYVRFYARFSGLAGSPDGGMATPNHCGFLSMYSGSPPSTDPNFWQDYNHGTSTGGQIRLGSQSNVIDWNNIVMGADATLPDLGPMGIAQSIDPPANEWQCFEFHVDLTAGHIEFWLNGTMVPGLSWEGAPVAGVSDQWSTQGPPVPWSLQSFGLGWFGLNGAETAWYDDVAFASCRIGCQ